MLNGLRFLNIAWYNKELAIWYFPYLHGCFEFIFSKFSEYFCCTMQFTVMSDLHYCKYVLCKKYHGGKDSLSFVCSVYSFREWPEVKLQKRSGDFRGNVAGSQRDARLCCCGPAGRAGPVKLSLPCCSSLSPGRPLGKEGWWSARAAETWEHPARTWSRSWGAANTRFLSADWEGRAGRQDAEEGERWVNAALLSVRARIPQGTQSPRSEHWRVSALSSVPCRSGAGASPASYCCSVAASHLVTGALQSAGCHLTCAACCLCYSNPCVAIPNGATSAWLCTVTSSIKKWGNGRMDRQMEVCTEMLIVSCPGKGMLLSLTCNITGFKLVWLFGWVEFFARHRREMFWKKGLEGKKKKKKNNLWMLTEGLEAVRTYYEAWVEGQGFMFRV